MVPLIDCPVFRSPLYSFLFAGRNEASLAGGRRPKPDSVTTRLRRTFASIWWAWTCLARRKTSTAAAATTTTTATSAIPGKKSRRSELEIGFDAISNGKPRTYTHTHAHTHTSNTTADQSCPPCCVFWPANACAHGRKQWKTLKNYQKSSVFIMLTRGSRTKMTKLTWNCWGATSFWVSTSVWESLVNAKKLHFSSCSCVR